MKNKVQKKIIKKSNFTYYWHIRLIENYINKLIKRKIRLLDFGCGVGTLDLYIAKTINNKSMEIVIDAYDISKKAIDLLEKSSKIMKINNIRCVKNRSKFLNQKLKYDIVMCIEVIEHIEKDKDVIKFLTRLVNKEGFFILSAPSSNTILYRLGLLKKFDKRVGHKRRYTCTKLIDLINEEKSLKIIEVKRNEGIFRNILFVYPRLSFLIKFLKGFLSDMVNWIDKRTICIFGESNIIIVAKKK